jgi:hypothetical protein
MDSETGGINNNAEAAWLSVLKSRIGKIFAASFAGKSKKPFGRLPGGCDQNQALRLKS